jgi:hypothetical protein
MLLIDDIFIDDIIYNLYIKKTFFLNFLHFNNLDPTSKI